MTTGQSESKPTALNMLQCQKCISEESSILPTVEKNIARQEKQRNKRGNGHSVCYCLPQNSIQTDSPISPSSSSANNAASPLANGICCQQQVQEAGLNLLDMASPFIWGKCEKVLRVLEGSRWNNGVLKTINQDIFLSFMQDSERSRQKDSKKCLGSIRCTEYRTSSSQQSNKSWVSWLATTIFQLVWTTSPS